MHVFVLTALDGDEIKETIVLTELEKAQEIYATLQRIYGGANAALASRKVDDIPSSILRAMAERADKETPEKPDLYIYGGRWA